VHAIEKIPGYGSTIGAVLLAGHIGQRLLRLDLQFAVKRIGGVDRLYFDQRLIGAIRHARHGAHGGAFGKPALPFDEGAFFRRRFALIEREADIAAENALALRGNAGADRTRHGIDSADGGNPKRDTGEENIKTGKPTAHFTEREAEGEQE